MNSKQRILVVDDDPGIAGIVKQSLERTGDYEVRTEHRGADGLRAAHEFKPDLLLLDIVMPECDGGDVLTQFRRDDALKNIPVVFLTGTMTEAGLAARDGTIAGCAVISKQTEMRKLAPRIEKILRATTSKG